ncbi:MAG TPA: RHS repeat-associated core domain-containing protein [Vicinamibacterales bacterium]
MSSGIAILDDTRGLGEKFQNLKVSLTNGRPSDPGLGGWSFSPRLFFDGRGQIIYDGNGTVRGADTVAQSSLAMTTYAGNTNCCIVTDGMPATQAPLDYPQSIAPDGAGNLYLFNSWAVQKIDPTGHIFTIAGNQTRGGFSADGTPASSALLNGWDVAVSPDGVVYVNDQGANRVRAIADGKLVTVAGNGQPSAQNSGQVDGVQATSVAISPQGITFGPDGLLYIADAYRVLRLNVDGTVNTLAGGKGLDYRFGDGIPARDAGVGPLGIAVGQDGSVYVSDATTVRRIGTDGIIRTIAGSYNRNLPIVADGQLANSGNLGEPWGLTVGPDGTLFIADLERPNRESGRVMAVSPAGIIRTVAGNGAPEVFALANAGSLALGTQMNFPWDVKIGPDGSLFALNYDTDSIHNLGAIYPAVRPSQPVRVVAAADGGTADVFDTGRHVRTIDLLTGAVLQTFGYDVNGLLISITDADNNVTHIERDGDGNVTAFVAPGGQRTGITISGRDLVAVSKPAGENYQFTYDSLHFGLLSTLTDPHGGIHRFTYDDTNGALIKDADPAGGFTALVHSGTNADSIVTSTSAEGRTSVYEILRGSNGSETQLNTGSDGLLATRAEGPDGKVSARTPDGASSTAIKSADPRFGMMAPIPADGMMTLGSHTLHIQASRNVTLTDPLNALSLSTLQETATVNGRAWKHFFTAATFTDVATSPAGRLHTDVLDNKGRPVSSTFANLTPATFTYDATGLLSVVAHGSRQTTFTYDAARRLSSMTDPLGRTLQFGYDAADRLTRQALPDGRAISIDYDAAGNVTSITPPGRSPHLFTYTPVDAVSSYTPPPVTPGGATIYSYNKDRQLTVITRPDTSALSFIYDGAGRLATLATASGNYTYQFNSGSGLLASVTAPDGGGVSYNYDGPLMTSETWAGAVVGTVSHAYDDNMRISAENGTSYQYDPDGLMITAGALAIQRDPQNGFITGTTVASVSDSWQYSSFGELGSYALSYSGAALLSLQYTRDEGGRVQQATATVDGTTTIVKYDYDAAGRLSTVTRDGVTAASYAYDDNGNRLSRTTPNGTESATYDDQDRILTYGAASFTYTPNGELATTSDPNGTTTYSYDALGNLHVVTLPNGTTIEYLIDAMSRRVGKKVSGLQTRKWLYGDRLRPVAELDGSGNVVSTFVYGTRSNVPDYMVRAGVTYRFITDHLGSPLYLLDAATNTLAQKLTYDEFGNVLADTNPGFQPFGFAGGLYDPDTALTHFGVRDYDAAIARWTAKDPVGFNGGSTNLYGYTFNDPVNFIDSTGKWIGVDEVGGALIGGVVNTGSYVVGQLIRYHGNVKCISGRDLAITFGIGFAAGFFATDTFGASVAVGVAANTAQYAAIQAAHGRSITVSGLTANGVTGALGGVASSALKAAEANTIENIARGADRYNYPTSAIDKAIDAAPRGAAAGYIANANPDCGCQ